MSFAAKPFNLGVICCWNLWQLFCLRLKLTFNLAFSGTNLVQLDIHSLSMEHFQLGKFPAKIIYQSIENAFGWIGS